MKFEIMLGILFDLLSKTTVKASYLADKYEVSVRSIYRYLNGLENAGIPLYTVKGANGGIRIVDTFRFSSTFMTVSEYEHTVNALTSFNNSVPDKILSSAINKLKSNNKNVTYNLDVKAGNLIIDASPWGDTIGYKSKLSVIKNCIENHCKLLLKYHDRNGEITNRKIEPYLILFKQGIWYTYAFCDLRNDFRFFKIGRIEHATVLNETFTRKELKTSDINLDFWENAVTTEHIELEIDKTILSDIEEWLGIENIETVNQKHYANVYLPFDNGLISKIMSFGNKLKVINPPKLKKTISENAKEILKLYN